MNQITAYAFSFAGLDGETIRLADYAGKPVLIVNTASQCDYTPQYAGLQQFYSQLRERGLVVIGVPSDDFGGQEPGEAADIARTAHGDYHVSFPMAAKAQVRGRDPHPFYSGACVGISSEADSRGGILHDASGGVPPGCERGPVSARAATWVGNRTVNGPRAC